MFDVRCFIVDVRMLTSSIRHQTSNIFFVAVLIGTLAGSAGADETAYNFAVQLYRNSQWQQAATAFAETLSDDSQDSARSVAAHFYQGECLMQLEDYSKAREHYRIVLKQASTGPYAQRALFRIGESSWLANDADSSKPLLQEFVRTYPHDALAAYALTYLGEIELLGGNPEQSIAAYQTVVERFSHTSHVNKARLGLAKSLLAAGRTDEVHLALARLISEENAPFVGEALLILGRSHYEAGEYDVALEKFRRISLSFPEHRLVSQAKLAAGWSLWKLGVFEEVADEVASLAEKPKWIVDANYLIGMAEYGQDNWPGAVQRLNQALEGAENHPGRDAILFYLGENCLRDGQVDAAAKWFQTLGEQHPHSRWADDALWGIARIAQKGHEVDKFQTAVVQLQNRFPKSHYLDRLKQLQTGEEEYIALPYENDILNEAAGLQRDGLFDAALAAYHELLDQKKIGRTHSEALRLTAQLHNQLAQYPEANRLFKQFLDQYPDSVHAAEVISELAWIGNQTGNLDVAATKFQTLYENFPQSPQALEAAYWLAHAAADKEEDGQAATYVDWLFDRLAKQSESRPKSLWEQTILLKCQLAAASDQWQEIKEQLAQESKTLNEEFEDGPRKTRAFFWLAEAEFRTGHPNEALALFDQLVEQTKNSEEPWIAMVPLRRAQLRSRRQQWTEVLKILGKAGGLRLETLGKKNPKASFPLQYEVDYLRGRAHAGLGEMTSARREYRRVLNDKTASGTTTETMAQWMIGETFFHQNDYSRARQAYRKVIDGHTRPEWQARAALQEGKCWELEQNWEEAKAVYSNAIKQWQGSDSAAQLKARLKWANSQTTQRR